MDILIKRGIRNNNPGNIRRNCIKWRGMRSEQTDSLFVQFTNMSYGIRALIKVLYSYYYKYNKHSIKDIIARYAPSNENNTENYIKYVCKYIRSDYSKFEISRFRTFKFVLLDILPAICLYESGYVCSIGEIMKIYRETFNKNIF